MCNRKLNAGLLNFILVCSVFLLSACTENKYNNNQVTPQPIDTSVQINKVKMTEYIIVLKEDVKITDALNSLKIYDVQLIEDLKRARYLVGLKNDPGIEQLQKDILNSKYIKHIQPNFIYTTQ